MTIKLFIFIDFPVHFLKVVTSSLSPPKQLLLTLIDLSVASNTRQKDSEATYFHCLGSVQTIGL